MNIKVIDKKGVEDIAVVLTNITFSCDNVGNIPNVIFWLNSDEADSLAFHLQSVLQDRERRKKK